MVMHTGPPAQTWACIGTVNNGCHELPTPVVVQTWRKGPLDAYQVASAGCIDAYPAMVWKLVVADSVVRNKAATVLFRTWRLESEM